MRGLQIFFQNDLKVFIFTGNGYVSNQMKVSLRISNMVNMTHYLGGKHKVLPILVTLLFEELLQWKPILGSILLDIVILLSSSGYRE